MGAAHLILAIGLYGYEFLGRMCENDGFYEFLGKMCENDDFKYKSADPRRASQSLGAGFGY